jgi:pilus assembly protein Flp/PilA
MGMLKVLTHSALARMEQGQTLAEYALILGLIAVVSIVAVTLLGNNVSSLMNTVASTI